MKKYELMMIVNPTLTSAEQKELLESTKSQLGDITYEENGGLRDLAYPIKKHKNGTYVVWNFTAQGRDFEELDRNLRLNSGILRHLLISIPEESTPTTLKELASGMELLRIQKAKIRDSRHGGIKSKRSEKLEDSSVKPVNKPAPRHSEPKTEVTPAQPPVAVPKADVPPVEAPEAPTVTEKKEEKKTSLEDLEKKLDKMFDDSDLGF